LIQQYLQTPPKEFLKIWKEFLLKSKELYLRGFGEEIYILGA